MLGVGEDIQYANPIKYWTVDGRTLGDWLARWTPEGPEVRQNGFVRTSAPKDLRALLGQIPAPLPSGRTPLCVCSQCGDLSCGTFTVRVARDDSAGTVIWSDFAWESDHAPELGPDTDFEGIPDLNFDLPTYDKLVKDLLK